MRYLANGIDTLVNIRPMSGLNEAWVRILFFQGTVDVSVFKGEELGFRRPWLRPHFASIFLSNHRQEA